MKKFIVFISFILAWLVIYGTTFAQSAELPTATTDIKEIKARYCNDPKNTDAKSLFIDAKIDEKSVICIDFINTSAKKASIGINFVDATVTNDSSQNKACLPEWEKTNFWQYVSNYPETLEIQPNSVKRIFVDILYSGGFAGSSYGCLTYHALDAQNQTEEVWGNMLNVFSRVGSFIDAFVQGDFKLLVESSPIESELYTNLSDNPNFYIYRVSHKRSEFFSKDFWTYNIKRNVTNKGNLGVTGNVDIVINDWYIIQSTTKISDQIILPWQTRTFEYTIPRYMTRILWGPIQAKGIMSYEGIYLWTYALQAPQEIVTLYDEAHHNFFPWFILLIIIAIIYKLYKLYIKKRINKQVKNSIITPKEKSPSIKPKKTKEIKLPTRISKKQSSLPKPKKPQL